MLALDIAAEEIASGKMTPEHIEAAANAVRAEGFVVLNHVIALDHIRILREKMLDDLEAFTSRPDAPYNFHSGNIQQNPPPFHPYLFRDVLLNEMALAVSKAVLGPGVTNSYYSGNTALPGTQTQPVHPDVGQLWENMEAASPAFGLVINVPLVDMSAENGSTQLWPGTHRDTTMCMHQGNIKVPEEKLKEWERKQPPIQPDVKAGAVLIRDIRLWHRGMPNRAPTPRPMIAMIHWCSWWNDRDPMHFPKGTEDFFTDTELRTNVLFQDDADYIHRPQAYDFHPDSPAAPMVK